ncbi:MAG: PD-(D/E)XK motif protein, partial [Pseudomonadota bacterium]
MGRLIDQAGLAAAWRALSGQGEPGWRTIPLGAIGAVQVLAGRRFPGNEEAVLFGIPGYRRPANEQLPAGRGFEVLRVTLKDKDEEPRWLGVNREAQGSFDLFAMMITDLLDHLASRDADTPPDELGTALVARVRAWQEFMQRGSGVLGPEAEVGLVGELRFLEALLESGLAVSEVLDGWKGPLDGLHDFAFPGGAIEVKSTVASVGFTA